MKWLTHKHIVVIAITLGISSVSLGEILYNNFGPDGSFDMDGHYYVGDLWFMGMPAYTAMRFEMPAGTYTDIAATLPLAQYTSDPNNFHYQVKIYASDGVPSNPDDYPGEMCPGTCLASIDAVASDLGKFPQTPRKKTFEFSSLELTCDTEYWLVMETDPEPSGGLAWYLNDIGVYGWNSYKMWQGSNVPDSWVLKNDDPFWGPNSAMLIEGTLVPEPASLALFLLIGAATARRR